MRLLTVVQEELFWSHVDKLGMCWRWTAYRDTKGYGHCNYKGCRTRMAHKLAYELLVGPVPLGRVLDHFKCDNVGGGCVTPWHLRPVTPRENTLRGNTFQARNLAKVQCPLGHAYSEENTYYYPNGRRECRICAREYKRAYKQRRRAA